MYLKSLTLRGFKSFASATTLHFEKGITAVVGPNGSGKSNVVDAIAWVLGEQGAKALRGGKMEDVIFAGTADRQPLGRAEVTLTIDNTDGALPIDYTTVSITRRVFRDGGGEYELNGRPCRLLDIQELLSDSGIGREMHVIVGQGQLDAVLQARPEDRRAFIEEAAGVLKHRKRKEKALRKLDAMQANLTRLTDLTAELRRQLKPLGRQAEVARRASTVQSDLRDSKARLLADDLAALIDALEQDARDEQSAQVLRTKVQAELAEVTEIADNAADEVAAATPALSVAQDLWFSLSSLAERYRGTLQLAKERARNLAEPPPAAAPGRDPLELEEAAAEAELDQVEKMEAVEESRELLAEAMATRAAGEVALQQAEQELRAAGRAIADRREGLATLGGQVAAVRSRLGATEDEAARLAAAVADARSRADQAQKEFTQVSTSAGHLDSSEVDLDDAHEAALAAEAEAVERVRELTEELRTLRSGQTGLRARVEALSLGLDRKDAAGALLAAAGLDGISGALSTVLDIDPGFEAAVAGALGALAEAVVVDHADAAVGALAWLAHTEGGRAQLVVGGGDPVAPTGPAPAGGRWLIEAARGPQTLAGGLSRLLSGVVVVDDLDAARQLVAAHPQLRAVTRSGDVFAENWAAGGSVGKQSVLELQAVLDRAEEELAEVGTRIHAADALLGPAKDRAQELAARVEVTLNALHESDARMSAVEEQLGRLGTASRSATAEAERLELQRANALDGLEQHRTTLQELSARLEAAQSQELPEEVDPAERDSAVEVVEQARQREVEARLALRTAEERARSTAGVAENLRRQAQQERDAAARAEKAAARRAAGASQAEQVADLAQAAGRKLERALARAAGDREAAKIARDHADATLATARARAAELQKEWDRLTDAVHKDEVLRAQQTLKIQQLAERALNELGLPVAELVAEYGPEVPVPPSPAEVAEFDAARERGEQVTAPQPVPFDRGTQERRAKRAERDLATLGKVNPLALEEFAALEERHQFLSTQLEDLTSTRKELLSVVSEVDDKILDIFTAAYHDVEREFVTVFATLFPGGDGELVLTDPANMLTTGIEVHARPPGKKVKRLSLLSGGERSLTAVALLVAIFRARPSPFYIMDEVEAALDEVNLNRLVGLLTQLRDSSQLIIITHQKYTMESADALYGVSMRGDGITQVISQRIRDNSPETAPTS